MQKVERDKDYGEEVWLALLGRETELTSGTSSTHDETETQGDLQPLKEYYIHVYVHYIIAQQYYRLERISSSNLSAGVYSEHTYVVHNVHMSSKNY